MKSGLHTRLKSERTAEKERSRFFSHIHLDPEMNSRGQQSSGYLQNNGQPKASQTLKLQEKFRTERPRLSYADLHDSITRNVRDVPPKPSWNQKRQQICRKVTEEEEVVRRMPSVPSYLERGEKPQEKVSNVEVLDWGLLEKWQYSKKQLPCRSSRCSPSGSNSSSYFSTDGSSIHSSRRNSCSPSRERMRRLSLQYHLMASPIGGHPSAARSSGESVAKFQDLKAAQSSFVNGKFKFIRTDQPFSKSHVVPSPNISREGTPMPKKLSYEVVSTPKENKKTQDGEYAMIAAKFKEHKSDGVDQDVPESQKTVVLLLPRDFPQNNQSGVSQVSGPANMFGQRSAEVSRKSFSERSKEAYNFEVKSGITYSCPLPCEANSNRVSQSEQTGSIDAGSMEFPPALCHSISRSAKIGISPSRSRNLQESSPTMIHSNSRGKEFSKGLNMKDGKEATEKPSKLSDLKAGKGAVEKPRSTSPFRRLSMSMANKETDLKASKGAVEKPRSTSPFRRLSMSMAKISRSSGHKECLTAQQLTTSSISATSDSENAVVSTSLDCSRNGKANSTGRARSSPLRRLLDPLMKPKPTNCSQFSETSQRDSVSSDHTSRSASNGLLGSPAEHLRKSKLDLNESCRGKKYGSSTFQALLRVAVKNGLPLFTFAVDNDSDIIAATSKLSTSGKEEHSGIYTFFSIQEVKKQKANWIIPGGKGKGHDYIPDVVAQMKVSDAPMSNLAWPNSVDHFKVKEFVLFSLELGENDQGASNFQPSDELAAIVVKMPKKMQRDSTGDVCQSNNYNKFSGIGLEERFLGARRYSYSGDSRQNCNPMSIQESISTTVILPSGTHSLPNRGKPSSLVQRWRSGGSCDCEGWDLSCKLKILASSNQQRTKKLRSSSTKDQFELFSQDVVENRHALSLAPFKDGIFSVEFNSSLSLLQAFSTCIAILDSSKPNELSESSGIFDEKAYEETILVRDDGTRVVNHVGDHPTNYSSYPPLSPVGRV